MYPQGDPMPHAELLARIPGTHAILSLITDRVDAEVIAAGSDLKVIANVAVGYNKIGRAHV